MILIRIKRIHILREDPSCSKNKREGRRGRKGREERGGNLLNDGINGRSCQKTHITLAFIHPWDLALLETAYLIPIFAWIKRCCEVRRLILVSHLIVKLIYMSTYPAINVHHINFIISCYCYSYPVLCFLHTIFSRFFIKV
jgi:hypothetical protein